MLWSKYKDAKKHFTQAVTHYSKEDKLSALCALGKILQSIGDYEQSFEYYENSLKLAGELYRR